MASPSLLDAATRAFAMVCMADGRVSPLEERHFLSFVERDAALRHAAGKSVRVAWANAIRELTDSKEFEPHAKMIAKLATTDADKETVMRAAQAALVADHEDRPNENAAIRALAIALKLDPEKY
jgi:tellurite resistance protein